MSESHINKHTHTHTHTHTHKHTHTHTHSYIHTYTYMYTYLYVGETEAIESHGIHSGTESRSRAGIAFLVLVSRSVVIAAHQQPRFAAVTPVSHTHICTHKHSHAHTHAHPHTLISLWTLRNCRTSAAPHCCWHSCFIRAHIHTYVHTPSTTLFGCCHSRLVIV